MVFVQVGPDGKGRGIEVIRTGRGDEVGFAFTDGAGGRHVARLTKEQAITLAGAALCAATGGADVVGCMEAAEKLAEELRRR